MHAKMCEYILCTSVK